MSVRLLLAHAKICLVNCLPFWEPLNFLEASIGLTSCSISPHRQRKMCHPSGSLSDEHFENVDLEPSLWGCPSVQLKIAKSSRQTTGAICFLVYSAGAQQRRKDSFPALKSQGGVSHVAGQWEVAGSRALKEHLIGTSNLASRRDSSSVEREVYMW